MTSLLILPLLLAAVAGLSRIVGRDQYPDLLYSAWDRDALWTRPPARTAERSADGVADRTAAAESEGPTDARDVTDVGALPAARRVTAAAPAR